MTIINIPPGVSRSRLDDDLAALQANINKKVSKAGDTMTGKLKISGISDGQIDIVSGKATGSNSSTYSSIRILPSNLPGKFVGLIVTEGDSTFTRTRLNARLFDTSGTQKSNSQLDVISESDSVYAQAHYRNFALRRDRDILCHGSIPTDTRILHTTGNETATGVKTFEEIVRDPIRQFSFVCPPNSNAANAPYYCVAEINYTDIGAWGSNTMEMDVVPGWNGGDVRSMQIACRVQTAGATDGIPNLSTYRLYCTGRRGIYNTLMDESRWTLAINTTTHIVQIWVKVEFNQTNLIASMTHNSRRNGEKGFWTLHRNPTGVAALPSEDDGWTLVTCRDSSGYIHNSARIMSSDPSIHMNHLGYTRGTNPSATRYWVQGRMCDSAGNAVMSLEGNVNTSGGRTFQLGIINDAGAWKYPFKISTANDGSEIDMFGISSPMFDSKGVRIDDNRLITAKMLAGDSGVVHTTGAESIAGVKTFTSETVHSNRLTILNNAYLDSDNEKTISFRTSSGMVKGYVKIGTDYILKVRGDQGVVIDNGAGVATLGESPSDSATGKEIATAAWVRSVAGPVTVIDGTIGGTVISVDLSDVTFHTANRLLEVHISARSDLIGGSAMYGQFTIPLAPEGNIGLASPYFDVPAGNGRFQITYSDSSTEDTAIFEIAVITSTGGDITDDCSIYPYAIAL